MKIFMIGAISYTKNNIEGYRLLDFETGQVKDVAVKALFNAIKNGLKIENLSATDRELVGTNGAISRYPLIINGIPYKKSPLIILKEMNNGDYTVSDFKGEIVRMKAEDVIRYSEAEGIANGKIVERDGTKFISAICGEYDKEPPIDAGKNAQRIQLKWDMLDIDDYMFNSDNELLIKNKDLQQVKLPSGVVKLAAYSFRNMAKLTDVILSDKLEYIGKGSFMDCVKLKSIVIPNGVKVIPNSCFLGCVSLEHIEIPPSVLKIEARAFYRCRKLKRIELRNPQTYIEFGALPPGCRKVII